MSAEDKEWWHQVTKKGKWNFIFVRGGLLWGLPVGVTWNVINLILRGSVALAPKSLGKLLLILGVFYLSGSLLGAYHWHRRRMTPHPQPPDDRRS